MENRGKGLYIRRTQKDYSMSFKLNVVSEVESGEQSITSAMRKYGIQSHGTILNWCKKFGTFDREMVVSKMTNKTLQQQLYELEQENLRLKRQNAFLTQEAENAMDKAIILDKLVELAEREYKVSIRKNSFTEQSAATLKRPTKR